MEQYQVYLIGNNDKYGRIFLSGWKYNFLKDEYKCEYTPFIENAYIFPLSMINETWFLSIFAGLMRVKGNKLLRCEISLTEAQLRHTIKGGEYGRNTMD